MRFRSVARDILPEPVLRRARTEQVISLSGQSFAGAALAHLALDVPENSMTLLRPVNRGQSQARPFSRFLGGEEQLKDPFQPLSKTDSRANWRG
jgi:hypothetical protein